MFVGIRSLPKPEDYPQEDEMTAENKTETEIRPVMTVAETSKMLGADPRTISKAIENGTIQAIRIGRRTLVLRAPFEAMLRGEA